MLGQTSSPPLSPSLSERVLSLPAEQLHKLSSLLTPKLTPFIPHQPTPPQTAALLLQCREALYGGAAGGGKSDWLLMAALQYVDVPGYSAVLFRKKFADLAKPGALMDRAGAWLTGTAARWNEQKKQWRFPSGAVLSFGYLESPNDFRQHQGPEYQFVGFDELTQHEERHYRYLFSRLRRLAGSEVPIRMRSASNPGDTGHAWVFRRFFIEGRAMGRVFIPAKLEDNPYLDLEEYEKSLDELDPVLRAQLRHGDWSVIDRTNAVIPEFTKEVAAATVANWTRPTHLRPYAVADTGTRDLTVVLYGFPNFMDACLHIEAEDVMHNPSTLTFGETVAKREAELWGTYKRNHGGKVVGYSDKNALSPRRFADASLRLSTHLRADHLPTFGTTEEVFDLVDKRGAEVAQNRARTLVGDRKIRIHPSCEVLLATLGGATYNEKRTDFQRTPETGHADAWMALVYMVRMVDWGENPFPAVDYGLPWEAVHRETRNQRAFTKAKHLVKKLKPLT